MKKEYASPTIEMLSLMTTRDFLEDYFSTTPGDSGTDLENDEEEGF